MGRFFRRALGGWEDVSLVGRNEITLSGHPCLGGIAVSWGGRNLKEKKLESVDVDC